MCVRMPHNFSIRFKSGLTAGHFKTDEFFDLKSFWSWVWGISGSHHHYLVQKPIFVRQNSPQRGKNDWHGSPDSCYSFHDYWWMRDIWPLKERIPIPFRFTPPCCLLNVLLGFLQRSCQQYLNPSELTRFHFFRHWIWQAATHHHITYAISPILI